MTTKHGDFVWYELLTTDADAAESFYRDVIGWKVKPFGQPGMDYRFLSAGDGEIGGLMQLTDEMTAGGARPVWLGYIGVDDVDMAVASITKAGGAVHMPASDIPNVGRLAMVADPQGAPFYVMRGASDAASLSFAYDRPRLGACAWNELATSDRAAAMAFYADQFGWIKDGEMDMGPLGAYEFVRRAHVPGMFGAMMAKPNEMPVSLWTYYFRVGDVDIGVEKTKAGGGVVVNGPMEIPGGEFAVNAVDPQGAMFAFIGPRN